MRGVRWAQGTVAGLLLLAAATGCGPATYNVRAARAFANEDANAAVVADRTKELELAVALAGRLLGATPYSPGDPWVRALRLDDDGADKVRERFADAAPYDGEYEVPIAKLYRVRVDEALARAAAPRPSPAKHANLFAAMGSLAAGARTLPVTWEVLTEARRSLMDRRGKLETLTAAQAPGAVDTPEIAALRAEVAAVDGTVRGAQQAVLEVAAALRAAGRRDGEQAALAKEALDAVTFIQRLQVEALAMAPYVVKQARYLARDAGGDGREATRLRALVALIDEQQKALDQLANALVVASATPLDDAAGYAMHEGLIEQAAYVNFDASHLKVKTDFDMLFFHELASVGASGGENDYTGRTRRLTYDVDPVSMVGARAIVTYDFLHVKNAASLNAGFRTNRLWSQGGDIQYTASLGELVGLDGLASDFFDIGADLLGFNTSVKLVTFTSGTVSEVSVDPLTGADTGVVATVPFQLRYQQIDVGFDLTKLFPEESEDAYLESGLVGFRYLRYELPRIFYALSQPDTTVARYALDRQSPPQDVTSQFYMGGFALRFGNGEWPRVSPYGDLALYGGAGPVSYYFTEDPTIRGGSREVKDATLIGLGGNASLGVRFRLTSYRSRPRLVTELSYGAEVVGQGIVSNIRGVKQGDTTSYVVDQKIDLGGFDLFHGPRVLVVAVF
jgi:hypothetical protein